MIPSFLVKDQLCPVAVDDLLSFSVQREMLLGKCCLAAGSLFLLSLISPGWKDHGTEEDRYDQS